MSPLSSTNSKVSRRLNEVDRAGCSTSPRLRNVQRHSPAPILHLLSNNSDVQAHETVWGRILPERPCRRHHRGGTLGDQGGPRIRLGRRHRAAKARGYHATAGDVTSPAGCARRRDHEAFPDYVPSSPCDCCPPGTEVQASPKPRFQPLGLRVSVSDELSRTIAFRVRSADELGTSSGSVLSLCEPYLPSPVTPRNEDSSYTHTLEVPLVLFSRRTG